jgi:hypothetical protein
MHIDGSWLPVTSDGEGQAGHTLVWRSLLWLAGESQNPVEGEEVPTFPGPLGGWGDAVNRLTAIHNNIDGALQDPDFSRLLADGPGSERDRRELGRALRVVRHLIAKVVASPSCIPASRGQPAKVTSDAAVVLLAGCWWLAAGVWPRPASKVDRFDRWSDDTLCLLRPDLSQKLDGITSIGRALDRWKKVTGDGSGPWLARNVLAARIS